MTTMTPEMMMRDRFGNVGLPSLYIVNVFGEKGNEQEHVANIMSLLGDVSRVDITKNRLPNGATKTSAFVYFNSLHSDVVVLSEQIHPSFSHKTHPVGQPYGEWYSTDISDAEGVSYPRDNPIFALAAHHTHNPAADTHYDMRLANCFWRLRINKKPRYTMADQLACTHAMQTYLYSIPALGQSLSKADVDHMREMAVDATLTTSDQKYMNRFLNDMGCQAAEDISTETRFLNNMERQIAEDIAVDG